MAGGPIRVRKPTRPSPLHLAVIVLSALAILSLALEHGFDTPPLPTWLLVIVQASAVLAFVFAKTIEFFKSKNRWVFARENWLDLAMIASGIAILILEWDTTRQPILKMGTIYVFTMQGLLLARFGLGLLRFQFAFAKSGLHSARLMLLSFTALILIGAALLMLPNELTPPHAPWRSPTAPA